MLRFDGEVFRFGTATAKPFLKKAAKLARKTAAELTKTAGYRKGPDRPFRIA